MNFICNLNRFIVDYKQCFDLILNTQLRKDRTFETYQICDIFIYKKLKGKFRGLLDFKFRFPLRCRFFVSCFQSPSYFFKIHQEIFRDKFNFRLIHLISTKVSSLSFYCTTQGPFTKDVRLKPGFLYPPPPSVRIKQQNHIRIAL